MISIMVKRLKNLIENSMTGMESKVAKIHDSYEVCVTKFVSIYDAFFPKNKIKLKSKDIQSLWITAGIRKSSKRKQRLYEKFLMKMNIKTVSDYLKQ